MYEVLVLELGDSCIGIKFVLFDGVKYLVVFESLMKLFLYFEKNLYVNEEGIEVLNENEINVFFELGLKRFVVELILLVKFGIGVIVASVSLLEFVELINLL